MLDIDSNGFIFTLVGSVIVISTACRVFGKDILDYLNQPRLKIEKIDKSRDLKIFPAIGPYGYERKFANLHIKNIGQKTAKRCIATFKILERVPGVQCIDTKILTVLHWADGDISEITSKSEPVEIGPEGRRLDIAFTDRDQHFEGCWVAIPFTLSGNIQMNYAYMPPGEYKIQIEVSCENGKGDKMVLKLTSPQKWQDIDMACFDG